MTDKRSSEVVGWFSGVLDLVHVRMSFVRNSGDPVTGQCITGTGDFGEVFIEAQNKVAGSRTRQ
ncbi:MAG: hypothetical protein IIB71_05545 [Proteobacteria bacterium]|nr:hypothetical protein [Pseudomonadota bacterium]